MGIMKRSTQKLHRRGFSKFKLSTLITNIFDHMYQNSIRGTKPTWAIKGFILRINFYKILGAIRQSMEVCCPASVCDMGENLDKLNLQERTHTRRMNWSLHHVPQPLSLQLGWCRKPMEQLVHSFQTFTFSWPGEPGRLKWFDCSHGIYRCGCCQPAGLS